MIFILIIAFVLRIVGVHYGLPNVYHQDEPIIVNHAMGIGAGGWNTHFFVIPPFTAYFLFILYGLYYLAGTVSGIFSDQADFARHFFEDPTSFYLIGRIFFGVVMGVATVALVARLGGKIFSSKAGSWAALFLAILPMHVRHSHYVYADVPVTFALTLLLYFLLSIHEKRSLKTAIFAGLALGWAVSIKYTAAYFAPMALLSVYFSSGFKKAAIFTAVSITAFIVIAPYSILDWSEFYRQVAVQAGAERPVGLVHHFSYSLLQGTGWAFIMLAFLGLWRLWAGVRVKAVFISVWVISYYLINAYFSQPFERYMMPILPVLAVLAGEGWCWVANKLYSKKLFKYFILSALILGMLLPALYSDFLFIKKDTRTQCLEWIEKNIPTGSVIVVDSRFWAPHLPQSARQVRKKYDELSEGDRDALKRKRLDITLKALEGKTNTYEAFLLAPADEVRKTPFLFMKPFVKAEWEALQEIGAEYLILNYADVVPYAHQLKNSAGDRLEPVAVFSPYRDPSRKVSKDPYYSTSAPHAQGEIFARVSLGPYLEVYKIKR